MFSAPTKQSKGFTLIELIVAISISTVIILMTTQIFIEGMKHTREVAGNSRLVSTASYVTDVLVTQIRKADEVVVVSSEELRIIDSTGVVSVIRRQNNTLQVDGNPIHASTIEATALSFTLLDTSVEVEYQLETTFAENPLPVKIVVTKRN